MFKGQYEENGPTTEDADVMFASTPVKMFKVSPLVIPRVVHY